MSIVHIAFYPSDWLAGTRGLSDSETGIYITLIARMYEMAGPIERDDERLSRLCGCKSKSSFVKALGYLISEGKIVETEDGLINERVEKEIKKVIEKSSSAKAAADARWNKKSNKNKGSKNADASPTHMRNGCQPEPEPESDTLEPSGSNANAREDLVSQTNVDSEFDMVWEHYPRKVAKAESLKEWRKARKKLSFDEIAKPLGIFIRCINGTPKDKIPHLRTWLHQERWKDDQTHARNAAMTSDQRLDSLMQGDGTRQLTSDDRLDNLFPQGSQSFLEHQKGGN